MAYAVIRVRGTVEVNCEIARTMELMGLFRVNTCAIVPEDDVTKGMLRKAKDYITWGEITEDTLANMIGARGRAVGDTPLCDGCAKEKTGFDNIGAIAKAVASGECRLRDIEGMKPVFRLHPPVKGYEGIKRSFVNGGALGYRGEAINDLIARML